MITLTLPYPPALNHLHSVVRGRKVLSREGRAYKIAVGLVCNCQKVTPTDRNVSVTMRVYRPRKAGDLDNSFKATFDSLTGHVWLDDRQIVEIHAFRYDDKEQPRIEVEVREIDA